MEYRPDGRASPAPRHAAPPEPAGPGPGTRVGFAALALTLVAAMVVVGYSLARDLTEAGPAASVTTLAQRTPAPQPTVVPTANAGPQVWTLPERTWEPLPAPDPDSTLYTAQVTALDELEPPVLEGCPAPETVAVEGEWREAVAAQWDCLHDSWAPVFEELEWPAESAAVGFFPGDGADSDCGYLVAPAFYCASGVGQVFFGRQHLEMAGIWDLSINEMVNHEYGHHLQYLAGVTSVRMVGEQTDDIVRRSELQAICWASVMTMRNTAVGFNEQAHASWTARLETMRADDAHGTRESILYWGLRGLYAETMGDCNTWVAPPETVA